MAVDAELTPNTVVRFAIPAMLALLLVVRPACAQADSEQPAQDQSAEDVPAEETAEDPVTDGILPIPDYSGDFSTRSALLGDLNGERTSLAEKGIQFGVNWNNTVQSVVDGGRDNTTAYGGTLDYNFSFDLMRMGVMPGAIVTLRGESRYGSSVNGDSGSIAAVNTDFFFPLTGELDEGLPLAITTLAYTQYLSETFGVFAGKFDTFDGDPNEFASGRGLSQFMNLNLNLNSTLLITVPYSTLGGGIVWEPDPQILLSSSIFTTADSSTTTGFDKIGDGWTWATELQTQYRLGRLPGGFNVGGAYAWDNSFTTIGRGYILPLPGPVPSPTADSAWAVYASVWQYVYAEEPADGSAPLDLHDGRPSRKGLGLFARLGFADKETNPISLAFSAGLGGRGVFPGRDDDIYGLGYFYNDVQTERVPTVIGAREYYQGAEAFYNIAVTPATGLTLDLQVVEPVTDSLDTAIVLGARFLVRF